MDRPRLWGSSAGRMAAQPMTRPAQKEEEAQQLALFRRVWAGAGEIASAEASDGPDVRGTLVGGRPFGMEIATLTEESRAQSDDLLDGSFTREIEAACAAERINNVSFVLGFVGGQANQLVGRAKRARAVALLVQLAKEAGGRLLDLDEDALEARGIDYFSDLVVEPCPPKASKSSSRARAGCPARSFSESASPGRTKRSRSTGRRSAPMPPCGCYWSPGSRLRTPWRAPWLTRRSRRASTGCSSWSAGGARRRSRR